MMQFQNCASHAFRLLITAGAFIYGAEAAGGGLDVFDEIDQKGVTKFIGDRVSAFANEHLPSIPDFAGAFGGESAEQVAKAGGHVYSIQKDGVTTFGSGARAISSGDSGAWQKEEQSFRDRLSGRQELMLRDVLPDSVNNAIDRVKGAARNVEWIAQRISECSWCQESGGTVNRTDVAKDADRLAAQLGVGGRAATGRGRHPGEADQLAADLGLGTVAPSASQPARGNGLADDLNRWEDQERRRQRAEAQAQERQRAAAEDEARRAALTDQANRSQSSREVSGWEMLAGKVMGAVAEKYIEKKYGVTPPSSTLGASGNTGNGSSSASAGCNEVTPEIQRISAECNRAAANASSMCDTYRQTAICMRRMEAAMRNCPSAVAQASETARQAEESARCVCASLQPQPNDRCQASPSETSGHCEAIDARTGRCAKWSTKWGPGH